MLLINIIWIENPEFKLNNNIKYKYLLIKSLKN